MTLITRIKRLEIFPQIVEAIGGLSRWAVMPEHCLQARVKADFVLENPASMKYPERMDVIRTIFDISPFNWTEVLCAMIAGAIIGFERQVSGKPIGIRTSILI